jgi:hypothetical protein
LIESQPGGFLFGPSPGIATLAPGDHNQGGAKEIPLRRYPRLGRAVFDLAKIPRLPEVRNLYETPIPLTWQEYDGELLRQACDALELRSEVYDLRTQGSNRAVENTTPAELLKEVEQLNGKRIYMNRVNLVLTTRPPKTWWNTMEDWWRAHRP